MTDRRMFIFLDESGGFDDFTSGGKRYLVLTSVSMCSPFLFRAPLDELRYDLLSAGNDVEYFHCANDKKRVRHAVFDVITSHIDSFEIDSLVVEKRKCHPSLRDPLIFYPRMLGYLLRYVLRRLHWRQVERVVVITDTIPIQRRRKAITKAVRTTLGHMVDLPVSHVLYHHASRAHDGLQVADYCCWAIARKWEYDDRTCHERIAPAIRSEFDIFESGDVFHD